MSQRNKRKRVATSVDEVVKNSKKAKKRLFGDVRYRVEPTVRDLGVCRVFVDGACSGNHHKRKQERCGGYGIYFEDGSVQSSGTLADLSTATTNNRLELTAVIDLLDNAIQGCYDSLTPATELRIVGDNQYVLNMALDWLPKWRARDYCKADGSSVENVDLVRRFDSLLQAFERKRWPLSFQWVRAHQTEPPDRDSEEWRMWHGNDRADRLATGAAENLGKTRMENALQKPLLDTLKSDKLDRS